MVCSERKIASGQDREQYYLQLAREDYYSGQGAPPGRWLGSGADALNLDGAICSGNQQLGRLMQGRHPHHPEEALRRGADQVRTYANGRTAVPTAAYDLTFSAPKSVSVLYGLSKQETQNQIKEAQRAAINDVADYLETNLCQTRTGRGGQQRERLQPVFAAFDHITSRAQDPQLHTHLLLMNTGLRPDGKGGAIDGRVLLQKETILALGQRYRDQLAHELQMRMDLQLSQQEIPGGTSFEIAGIPPSLCQHLSKRSAQIQAVASPEDSPKDRKQKVLKTRASKPKVLSHRELFRQWQEETRALGHEPEHIVVKALEKKTPTLQTPQTPIQSTPRAKLQNVPTTAIPPPEKHDAQPSRHAARKRQAISPLKETRHHATDNRVSQKPWQPPPEKPPPPTKALPRENGGYSPHPPYDEKYWRAISKAQTVEARNRSRRKRQELYLYLTGRISHQDFRRARNPEKYPKSKAQIHAAYAFHRISKRQRDAQLYIHGHGSYHETVPRTLVGTHFAYLTNQISKSHYIRVRAEKEAWKRYHKQQKQNERQPPDDPPRSLTPSKTKTMQQQQSPRQQSPPPTAHQSPPQQASQRKDERQPEHTR